MPSPSVAPTPAQPEAQAASEANAIQRKPQQVSFPPGTKGSPTEETAKAQDEVSTDQQTGATINHVEESVKLEGSVNEAKPSAEVSKASDAASSPESTVPSATTPAVHEASTDTSPEHDVTTYRDVEETKQSEPVDAESDAKETPAVDVTEPDSRELGPADAVESAEDQLLQESLQTAKGTETVEVSLASDQSSNKAQSKEDAPVDSTVASDSKVDVNKSVEIPDSREDTPDRMEVDAPAPSPLKSSELPEEAVDDQTPATPVQSKADKVDHSQPAQRAVTRVSSGAMRPRSVNEIVGGHSRQSSNADRTLPSKEQEQLTPLTSTSQSPTSRSQRISSSRKDKPKGQVSAVLFGKQPKKVDEKTVAGNPRETFHPSDDYYTPLFIQGFARSNSWMQPLEKILYHANKTIGTSDASLALQDHQACKVLHRVYHLQSHDKWSLRQPKRCPEPTRSPSHWDVLLKEAKWMRTDFREERKWKRVTARNLAQACADWCAASAEQRKAMQVSALPPPKPAVTPAGDVAMADDGRPDEPENEPTPDLISGDVASPQNADDLSEVFPETISPSAIFTLQEDDVVFGLKRTAAADQLLDELPMYGPPLKVPRVDMIAPSYDPDAHWRRPALPLSKYVEGQMQLRDEGPPRKRSRFNYHSEEFDDEGDSGFVSDLSAHQVNLPPTTDEVALFRPEMKHIRDRLHAGHQFRPPTDHLMPHQSFYECRNPSMWTMSEDDELRNLVREYSYNWPLISSMLATRSMFASGAERRTPWECFERWINLEGLPSDMQKTQYFKAYNARIEAAQRVILQNQMAQQTSTTTTGGPPQPVRRRPTTPLRVERRRNQKHLTLLDAMRKLAKKRETAIQKQQQTAAQNAANKKPNEPPTQRPNKTPREYSLLRWERDQALAEKMAHFASRQEATRRVSSPTPNVEA